MSLLRTTGWIVATLVLGVAGCKAKPEVVPTSGARAPTTAKSVKLYQDPPLRYEKLGLIRVPVAPDAKWDDRGNADAGFEKFKKLAAEKGANGVLFQVEKGEYDGRVVVGYYSEFYAVPLRNDPKTAVAEAIYVIQEH